MQSSALLSSVLAALVLLQGVPAPFIPGAVGLGLAISAGASAGAAAGAASSGITAGVISGVVSGAVGAGIGAGINAATNKRDAFVYAAKMAREVRADLEKRQDGAGPAPAGIPQYNWDECYQAALTSQITVTGPVGDNHIQVNGLPAVCMNLAAFMGGDANNGVARAVPCGSACIEYVNMTPEYYENMRHLINTEVLHL